MTRVMHFDRLDLRLDRESVVRLPGGGVQIDGIAARTGLYTYHDENGAPFVELVPSTTLFDQRSMDSMAGASFTIRHPDGLVTPEKFQAVTHGAVVKAWQASDTELGVRVRIGSDAGLKALEAGMVELSPGYEVDVAATPGTTEHGRHDGVQRERSYDHLSGLWSGEARGGPGMRLQLDGPVCAPAGCRIQSHRVRHDGPPRGTPMKITVKRKDGTAVELDGARFGWVRLVSLDAKAVKANKAQPKADQIETAEVTIVMEGEEPKTLVLPMSMVEMMLEGIGGATAAPATAPEGMEEEVALEAQDADEDPKMDGKITMDAIERMMDRKIDRKIGAQRQIDARDSEVQAHARKLKIDATDGRHWTQIALDAIAKADKDDATRAKKLAELARKGDAVAEGALREKLRSLAADAHEPGQTTIVNGKHVSPQEPKRDAKAPWNNGVKNKPESEAN